MRWNDGNTVSDENSIISDYIPIKNLKELYSNYNFVAFYYDSSKAYLGNGEELSTSSTANGSHTNVPNNSSISYARIFWRSSWNNNVDMTSKTDVMLTKNTVPTTYVPYNCIQIKKCNANLWDEQWELGQYNTTTGEKVVTSNTIRNKNPIYCLANTNYYVCINNDIDNSRVRLLYYDKSGNLLSTIANLRNTIITTPQNTAYINLMFNTNYGTTYNNDVCINLSDNQINGRYIAHAEKTYNFPLSEGQKLMQDGTIENKVVNEWREIVFDGTENIWSMDRPLTNSNRFYTSQILPLSVNNISVSNYFKNDTASNINTKDSPALTVINGKQIVLRIDNSLASSEQELKTWLAQKYASGNPLKVQIKLIEADETDFTTEQQAVIDEIIRDGTYKEVTHYTAEASLNPDIDITYYRDLPAIIDNLDARLTLVEG